MRMMGPVAKRLRAGGGLGASRGAAPPKRLSGIGSEGRAPWERLRALLSIHTSAAIVPGVPARRRMVGIALIAYVAVMACVAVVVNLQYWQRQGTLQAQFEQATARIGSVGLLIAQLDAEKRTRESMVARRDELYTRYAEAAELPVVMQLLAGMGARVGVETAGFEFSTPTWQQNVGRLQTSATARGRVEDVIGFLAALDGLMPSVRIQRVDVRFTGKPGEAVADIALSLAFFRERPTGARTWDGEAALALAERQAGAVAVAGFPFTPTAAMWLRGRAAGVAMPELRLLGVARGSAGNVALVAYDGAVRMMRTGDQFGGIKVLDVAERYVTVEIGGRVSRLMMRIADEEAA